MDVNFLDVRIYTQARINIYNFFSYIICTIPNHKFIEEIWTLPSELIIRNENQESDKIHSGALLLHQFISEINPKDSEGLSTALAVEWTRLFRGVKPGYGPPPAKASAYIQYDQFILHKFYKRMGLELAKSQFEPDFLGCQLGLLSRIIEIEFDGWNKKNLTKIVDLLITEKEFILNHLGWITIFITQAEKYMSSPFYKGILQLMEEFILQDLDWIKDLFIELGKIPREGKECI